MKRALPVLVIFFILFAGSATSFAWLFPEHRHIAAAAIESLDPARRALLDQLWAAALAGHEGRLSAKVYDSGQGEKPDRIDYATWPGLAGDHSCSSADMLRVILDTKWVMDVARITAKLDARLAKAKRRDQRVNAIATSDLQLQKADSEMVSRASGGTGHFVLARPEVDTEVQAYAKACIAEGADMNAVGIYAWYHLSALAKAQRLANEALTAEERSALALATLADEAFAFHFLEDSFAAGHVTGIWGSASVRKGTHDYYNEHGFATNTWGGKPIIIMGDGWIRPEDAGRAAEAVRKSLEQLLDAAAGRGPVLDIVPAEPTPSSPGSMNTCKLKAMPSQKIDPAARLLFADVVLPIPQPGLAAGAGEIPRFRSELGPFIGVVPAIIGNTTKGGFGYEQNKVMANGGLEVAVRLGVGLEGVLNESGDGLMFLDFGFRQDGASTARSGSQPDTGQVASVIPAIPGRMAYTARLRMPFWLIPGDLILALPIYLFSPGTYMNMAVQAANGGLIPWQAGLASPIGRFQFVLGREVGVAFFGYGREPNRLVIPTPGVGIGDATLIELKSIQIDFPFLEYRPFRTFSLNQSSSLAFQFYGGFDIPTEWAPISPLENPSPDLRTTWHLGIRVVFDWRQYFK
jgi:hypothetical protein